MGCFEKCESCVGLVSTDTCAGVQDFFSVGTWVHKVFDGDDGPVVDTHGNNDGNGVDDSDCVVLLELWVGVGVADLVRGCWTVGDVKCVFE